MRRIKAKIRHFIEKLKGRRFESIPLGLTDFNAFSADVLRIYEIPDMPSYRHAIATMVMHMGEAQVKIRKRDVALRLKKAMANQIAYAVIEQIRNEEKVKAAAPATSPQGALNDKSIQDQGILTSS